MRALVLVALVGCVQSSAVECEGFICPSDKLCDNANHQCVTLEQMQSCAEMDDGADCTVDPKEQRICSAGVCIASVCGDGLVRGSEQCDGDDLDRTPTCRHLGFYSDAAVTCNPNCTIDDTICKPAGRCGDGMINGPEFCEPALTSADLSCLDFGYDRGLVSCSGFCQPDFATCESFGFALVGTGSSTRMQGVYGTSANDVWFVGLAAASHWDGVGWTHYSIGMPTDTVFRAVWASGPTDAWAVGDQGVAAHFDGTAWTRMVIAPPDVDFEAITGTGPTNIFASGSDGAIFRFDGAAWAAMTSNTTYYVPSIWAAGPRDVYAVSQGDTGGDMHHYDGAWSHSMLHDRPLVSVHGRSATDIWALPEGYSGVGGAVVFHKTTGAFTNVETIPWSDDSNTIHAASDSRVFVGVRPDTGIIDAGRVWRVPSDELDQIWASGPDDAWAITNSGAIRHFAGTTWLANVDIATEAGAIAGTSDTNVFVAHNGSPSNLMFRWDGETWINAGGAPAGWTIRAMWAAAANDVWTVSADGGVRRYNGGWLAPMTTNTTEDLTGIFGLSANDVWAVGSAGTIIHYEPVNGWSQPHTGTSASVDLIAVWAANASTVYAIGLPSDGSIGAVMYKYAGGTSWTQVSLPSAPFVLFSLWGTGPDNIFAAGFGEILHWDGVEWKSTNLNAQLSLYAVRGTGPNDVYAIGDGGLMFHYDGTRWRPMRTGNSNELRHLFVSPHHVFVGSSAGTRVLLKP